MVELAQPPIHVKLVQQSYDEAGFTDPLIQGFPDYDASKSTAWWVLSIPNSIHLDHNELGVY